MKKITKQDRKLIAKVAKSLPKMQHSNETIKRVVHGTSILNRNPIATVGSTTNPVKANKLYISGDIPKDVNHRKELEKMFIRFGHIGIEVYKNRVLQVSSK